jgi:hypothetical protein
MTLQKLTVSLLPKAWSLDSHSCDGNLYAAAIRTLRQWPEIITFLALDLGFFSLVTSSAQERPISETARVQPATVQPFLERKHHRFRSRNVGALWFRQNKTMSGVAWRLQPFLSIRLAMKMLGRNHV